MYTSRGGLIIATKFTKFHTRTNTDFFYLQEQFDIKQLTPLFGNYTHKVNHGYMSTFLILLCALMLTHFLLVLSLNAQMVSYLTEFWTRFWNFPHFSGFFTQGDVRSDLIRNIIDTARLRAASIGEICQKPSEIVTRPVSYGVRPALPGQHLGTNRSLRPRRWISKTDIHDAADNLLLRFPARYVEYHRCMFGIHRDHSSPPHPELHHVFG